MLGSLLLSIFLICMMSCLDASPILIAHRGGAASRPENTIDAFVQCIPSSANFVEFDVQVSKDGVPVIFHDDTLERLTSGKSNKAIGELTLDEIHKFEVGQHYDEKYKGSKIPTLEEVLTLLPPNKGVMIEVKTFREKLIPPLKPILEVLEKKHHPDRQIVIGSLNWKAVRALKELNPQYPLIGIVYQTKDIKAFKSLNLDYYAVDKELLLNKSFFKELPLENYTLWSWTVNDAKELEKLLGLGVTGIISDDIAMGEATLAKHISKVLPRNFSINPET